MPNEACEGHTTPKAEHSPLMMSRPNCRSSVPLSDVQQEGLAIICYFQIG